MAFDPSIIPNSKKLQLTLDSSLITTDQIDFPLTVHLDSTNPLHAPIFEALGSNNKKLSITQNDVRLPVEIENWGSDKATIHTKVPTYPSAADGELILSWDETQVDNDTYVGVTGSTPAKAVWDSNFVAVYHMAQDPSGTAPQILDSTANIKHGTSQGSMTSTDIVDGLFGKALDFDGVNDCVSLNFNTKIVNFTLEALASTNGVVGTCTDLLINNVAYFASSITSFPVNLGITPLLKPVLTVSKGDDWQYDVNITGDPVIPGEYTYIAGVNTAAGSAVLYQNGVSKGSTGGVTPSDSAITWMIGRASSPVGDGIGVTEFKGKIGEVRISNIVRSANWIKLTNASFRGLLVTWNEISELGLYLRSILDQRYDLVKYLLRIVFEQPYPLTSYQVNVLEQIYGLRILVALQQLYGNTPKYRKLLDQVYGDVHLLRRFIEQLYGDLPSCRTILNQPYGEATPHRTSLTQPYGDTALLRLLLSQNYGDTSTYRAINDQQWNLPEALRQINLQRYGLSEEQLRAMYEQQYALSEVDLLRAQIDQLYVLAAGEAIVQKSNQEVVCDGRPHTSAYNLFIEQDESLYHMVGELQLADEAEFGDYEAYVTPVVLTIDGQSYTFITDGHPRRSRSAGGNTYVVSLASPTILLGAPHSKIDNAELSGMASQLVATLAAPFSVQWQLVNWFIPPGVLTSGGDAAIDIIKKIVAAAGGVVQTSPDGVLICRPEYPISVDKWSSAPPDIELTDQDDFFSIDPSFSARPGYNSFFISNQQAAGNNLSLEIDQVLPRQADIRVRQVPWSDTAACRLLHSGGTWVAVIDQGAITETVTEQVEVIAGAGQVSKPVRQYLGHRYTESNLGAVTVTEDGRLTTAIPANSLLQLTYATRYWLFSAFDERIEDVQFFPEVIDT